jgi:hypothetical protein
MGDFVAQCYEAGFLATLLPLEILFRILSFSLHS